MPPILVNDIAHFLESEFNIGRYPQSEQGGVYHPSERPIRRLGLALEPFPDLAAWVANNQLDALWLHRPWKLDLTLLPPTVSVAYNHLHFDEHLTMGYNPRMAAQLSATGPLEPLGFKQSIYETGELLPQRPIGMLFDTEKQNVAEWVRRAQMLFGGYDRLEAGRQSTVGRVAVVGAMNDALIREAADRGGTLYFTGQYRPSAQKAVDETGITVISVGHRRSEEWGVRALDDLLRQCWPELNVLVWE
ncbi:MAG: hypothetical protein JWP57_159 [Spirosoma sp.]|nr:hypothetical protein [Spirosoma sp.]